MPRQIFRNRVIATAGPLPDQLTPENLKRWTTICKGKFSDEFSEDVTHLLCTREQFNKRVPRVKEALKRGKRFHLVHYDWFEFSTVAEKRLPEREYSMRRILAKQMAAKRELARREKGRREGERGVNTNLFHIYYDRDVFPYQIDISRDEKETGEVGQRYTLCLWESNAKPHLYWFTAKFLKRKGDSQPSYYRPSPISRKWRDEMDLFIEFFHIKTGIEWQDRVIKEKTMPGSFFQYSPPTGGKPVGRRLRFCYDYCLEVNAKLRGLSWPPEENTEDVDKATAEVVETQKTGGDKLMTGNFVVEAGSLSQLAYPQGDMIPGKSTTLVVTDAEVKVKVEADEGDAEARDILQCENRENGIFDDGTTLADSRADV